MATLLDTAGRFLYRLPETHDRMANMAEVRPQYCGCKQISRPSAIKIGPQHQALSLLHRNAGHSPNRCGTVVPQIMMKLRASRNLDARQSMLLEHAYFQVPLPALCGAFFVHGGRHDPCKPPSESRTSKENASKRPALSNPNS